MSTKRGIVVSSFGTSTAKYIFLILMKATVHIINSFALSAILTFQGTNIVAMFAPISWRAKTLGFCATAILEDSTVASVVAIVFVDTA